MTSTTTSSSTATTAKTTKNRSSSKCSAFDAILKKAIWLKRQGMPTLSQQSYELSSITIVIDLLNQHLQSGCFCVIRSFQYFALATTYLEKFFLIFNNMIISMNETDYELHRKSEELRNKNNGNNNFINDLELKDDSQFVAEHNPYTTIMNFNYLMENLFLALKMYEKALDSGRKEAILSATFLNRFGVLFNMNTLYQIFLYYNLDFYALKVMNISMAIVDSYYCNNNNNNNAKTTANSTSNSQDDMVTIIKCNVIKLLLKFGCIRMASSYYKRYFGHLKFIEMSDREFNDTINSYENCLIFLIYCELSLRTRNGKQVAAKLKCFIDSEYLRKPTIKRYTIKAMAFALASCFPSINYSYENFFNEFIEPTHMSVGMCRRWNFFYKIFHNHNTTSDSNISNCANNNNNSNDIWWIRFTVLNIFAQTIETFLRFNINNGMTNDPVFYYKIATNLFTVTMNIFSLGKLRLISAIYDLNNGFYNDTKIKLLLFKKIFSDISRKCNEEIFINSSSNLHKNDTNAMNTNSDDNEDLNLRMINEDLNNMNLDDNDDDDDDPNSVNSIYKQLKRIINDKRSSSTDDDDDYCMKNWYLNEQFIQIDNLYRNFCKDFNQTLTNQCKSNVNCIGSNELLNLFKLYLLHMIILVILNYNETQNQSLISKANYLRLLKFLENLHMNIYLQEANKYQHSLKLSSSTTTMIHLKTTMDEQIINNSMIEKLFWLWTEFFVDKSIERIYQSNADDINNDELLKYLDSIIQISTYQYTSRTIRSKMFYYQAFVMYKQYKHQSKPTIATDKQSKHKVIKLLTHHLTNDNCILINRQQTTPLPSTPPTNSQNSGRKLMNNQMIAPKKPKDNLMNEYKSSLMAKLHQTNRLKNVEGTRREAIKFDDFDDDSDNDDTNGGAGDNQRQSSSQPASVDDQSLAVKTKSSLFNDDQESSNNPNSLDSLSKLFANLQIEQQIQQSSNDAESYFEKLLQIDSHKPTDVSIDNIRQCLKKAISYIGCHPTFKLYEQIHYLYYKLSKILSKNLSICCFHLFETASYHCFRLRLLYNTYKKLNISKRPKFSDSNISMIKFKNEDFVQNSYLNTLPKTWRFLQIKLLPSSSKDLKNRKPALLLCRYQYNQPPIIVKIKCDQQKDVKFFMEEFGEIMKSNSMSIQETERKAFWRLRFDTDYELKNLLKITELNVFGIFRGLFLGQIMNRTYALSCKKFQTEVLELAKKYQESCIDTNLLQIFIETLILFNIGKSMDENMNEIFNGINLLFNQCNNEQFIREFFDSYKKSFENWLKLSTDDLNRKLFDNIEPVGLIIDRQLNQFPFESLPSFRQIGQSFFRVPSLKVASLLYEQYKPLITEGIDDRQTFYLLNPGANLQNTEEFFKNKFLSINEWNGYVGQVPDGKKLAENFETKDIYIYMGHGSGTKYYRQIPNGGFDVVNVNSSSIVVGCCSGLVTNDTKTSDVFGSAYRFLINGAPVYIGQLWDVTDKDIDLFMDKFMSLWLKRWKNSENTGGAEEKISSLCKSITMARDTCKLRYLNGCATVVYGLPLKNLLKKKL